MRYILNVSMQRRQPQDKRKVGKISARRRPLGTSFGLFAAIVGSLLSRNVLAQTTVHATGVAGISFTDNFLGARTVSTSKVSTFYLTLVPGLELYHNRETSRFRLAYSHPINLHLDHSRYDTNGDIVQGQGIWLLSSRRQLMLGVSGYRMTTAAMLQTPSTGSSVAGDGRTRLLTTSVDETFTQAVTERLLSRQFSSVSRVEPLSGPLMQRTRYNVVLGLGADYALNRNAYGLQSSLNYYWVDAASSAIDVIGPRRFITADSFARYRRDLSETWSGELRAGVVLAHNQQSRPYTGPRWGAGLYWTPEGITGALAYDRTVSVSLTTGYATLTDALMVRVAAPLSRSAHLDFDMSTGLSHNQIFTNRADIGSVRTLLWTSYASIHYTPDAELPTATLTYAHFEQVNLEGSPAGAPGLVRNTISLFISGHYPSREFYQVPSSPSQRVDSANRDPLAQPALHTR